MERVRDQIQIAYGDYHTWREASGFEDTDGRRMDYLMWMVSGIAQYVADQKDMESKIMDMIQGPPASHECAT